MKELIIYNVRLNEDEIELFSHLIDLGFGQYLDELFSEFTGDKKTDMDYLQSAIQKVRKLLTKFGLDIDFDVVIQIERKEK